MIYHLTLSLRKDTPRLFVGYDTVLQGFELHYREALRSTYKNSIALSDGSLFVAAYHGDADQWRFEQIVKGLNRVEQMADHHWMMQGLLTWIQVRNQVHLFGA